MQTSVASRRVLDAAIDAFAEQGFAGTSTRDIAIRADRSPAAMYVHYESKEAVLYAISVEGHADALECLRTAYDATTEPADRLHGMIFAFSYWHMQNAKLGRVVQHELHALSTPHRADIIAQRRQFHRLMVDALTDGMRAGEFTIGDLDGTARALLSLCIDLVRWFDPALSDPWAQARLNGDLSLRIVGATR